MRTASTDTLPLDLGAIDSDSWVVGLETVAVAICLCLWAGAGPQTQRTLVEPQPLEESLTGLLPSN